VCMYGSERGGISKCQKRYSSSSRDNAQGNKELFVLDHKSPPSIIYSSLCSSHHITQITMFFSCSLSLSLFIALGLSLSLTHSFSESFICFPVFLVSCFMITHLYGRCPTKQKSERKKERKKIEIKIIQ
jgi:hypothetical protein